MTKDNTLDLASFVRDIPDFPKKGIIFKDITPLLQDKNAFRFAIDKMCSMIKGKKIDLVVSVEARGFIFGAAIAYSLGVGFVPVRKPGKLPFRTFSHTYDLEYGKDTVHIHEDAIKKSHNVLIVDDLLATGGTVEAATKLIEKTGGNVAGAMFLIELGFLNGAKRLKKYPIYSVIKF